MKKVNQSAYFILLAFLLLFASCNDDAENPDVIQLLINSSVESGTQSPNKWFVNDGDHYTEWSDEQSFTGDRSLMMS